MTWTVSPAVASFLAWEGQREERWEYVGGHAEKLAGVTFVHDSLSNNLRDVLRQRLRGTTAHAHGSQLKVLTPGGDVLYPDAFVLCGRVDTSTVVVDNPIVVFEVLSEGTAQLDLTRKRLAYRTIPSLKVIVYVAQDRARLDIVRRQADGRWDDDGPVVGLHGELALPEIGVTLGMAEIYEDVEIVEDSLL